MKIMNIIKLSKFSFFFVLNCLLLAMPANLQNSIEECEDLFSDFVNRSEKITQDEINKLVEKLNSTLSDLKKQEEIQEDDSDDSSEDSYDSEIGDISLQYESDIWFFGKLNDLLPNLGDKKLFKELYEIASNSPRYHYVMVKFMKDYKSDLSL